ncbi:MAG TPA: aldo/keto reductase [Thermoanaerobaculia bacterium]
MTGELTRRDAIAVLAAAALGCGARSSPASSAKAGDERLLLQRRIPSGDEMIPVIGLGTWQTFDVGTSASARDPLAEVLAAFVQLGGRVVDSSPMYGNSETVLGDLAMKLDVRDDLFVATKVWISGKEKGVAQMTASEQKLRGRVDLMQVHNLVDAEAHLETLKEWKAAGRIRYIGVTHYTSSAYAELARFLGRDGIDFVQVNYSLAERQAERRILPLAYDRRVAVLVNRPFGGGSLFSTVRKKPLPDFAADLGCTSWAELFLKFVVSHPAVTCAIPATSKVEHLRQNMNAGRGIIPDEPMRKRIVDAMA